MELILFPLALLASLGAIIWRRRGYEYFILGSYAALLLSAIHCLFDVAARIQRNDSAGILDIYPTLKWAYLAGFLLVTALNVFAVWYRRSGD